jgi:hypothetical protein
MPNYDGVSLPPVVYTHATGGTQPFIRLSPIIYEAVRAFGSVPTGGGSAGRPLSGQLYPRGNR